LKKPQGLQGQQNNSGAARDAALEHQNEFSTVQKTG